jgi:uncharacterized protein (TIGR02300 family)
MACGDAIFRPRSTEVAKPNWGVKRICQSCTARFYDLAKDPILCPKCGAEFDPEAILKTKRAKPAPAAPRVVPVPVAVEPDEIEPIEEEVAEAGDEKEEEVIEDTSELGEDDEDVAEVRDNVDEEER